nr:MAG TPA: hypothetical protein [Caudoviricetes sp.]
MILIILFHLQHCNSQSKNRSHALLILCYIVLSVRAPIYMYRKSLLFYKIVFMKFPNIFVLFNNFMI